MVFSWIAWGLSTTKRSAADRLRAKELLQRLVCKLLGVLENVQVQFKKHGSSTWLTVTLPQTMTLQGTSLWPLAADQRNRLRDQWDRLRLNSKRKGFVDSSFDSPSAIDYIMFALDPENPMGFTCESAALSLMTQISKLVDENLSRIGNESALQKATAFKAAKEANTFLKTQLRDAAMWLWFGQDPQQAAASNMDLWH